jgi:16S rRNA (cytosine1402-N4)-methyltransferase
MSNLQLALPGVLGDSAVEWVWRDDFDEGTDVKRFEHATVMRDEVVRAVAPRAGGLYVDATLGAGGHTVALLETEPRARIVGLDRDPAAIAAAEERLAPVADRVMLVRATFSRIREQLDALGIRRVDGVVADLGVSSPQLDDAERGMSFRREGPIDMRMDPESGETALELIDRLADDELADVLYQYGEERRSRRIARSIKKALAAGELRTTLDLRRAIVRAVGPARIGGVDPATRTFQALRIAVNRELEELERLLAVLPEVVAPGGVAAVISFHSLEDRLVKRAFGAPGWAPLTKKPLVASDEECARNARARSAKLRAARREAAGADAGAEPGAAP